MAKSQYGQDGHIKDWSATHMPKTEDYQAKDSEYAGMQSGKTDQYIERRDRMQTQQAKQVKAQDWHGRYE